MDNISKTPTSICTMILGVMILTICFSPEFLFVWELVILEKCDEFLFLEGKEKISLVFATSKVYYACVLEVCDFFHKSSAFFTSRGQMREPVLGRPPDSKFL